MTDFLTSPLVEQLRTQRAQAQPHLASPEDIARFRAVRLTREGLAVGKAVLATYGPEAEAAIATLEHLLLKKREDEAARAQRHAARSRVEL
jgi:hypothetical protein